uniref:hypothetical protein n=1 Tax=Klebsiella pneumoniae TaxID=573 RepID=UPI003EBA5B88
QTSTPVKSITGKKNINNQEPQTNLNPVIKLSNKFEVLRNDTSAEMEEEMEYVTPTVNSGAISKLAPKGQRSPRKRNKIRSPPKTENENQGKVKRQETSKKGEEPEDNPIEKINNKQI